MISIVLALVSAACYGTSDFLGGVLSGRMKPWTVALWGQFGALVAVAVAAGVTGGSTSDRDLWWAILAGIGNGLGTAFLYRGLSSGRMGTVAPVSGVWAAVLPVLAGLLGGERPGFVVWIGILIALPAIWLVARTPSEHATDSAGLRDGTLAGIGFGTSFAAIAQVGPDSGLWPVAIQMAVSVVPLVIGARLATEPLVPRDRYAWATPFPGFLGAAALVSFLLGAQHGHLTVTAVISALYPAATILLATALLRERIHPGQAVGLGLCAAAVSLVAAG